MKEFINGLTGTRMFVADAREAEYTAAGHRPVGAAPQQKTAAPASAQGQPPETGAAGSAQQPAAEPKAATDVRKASRAVSSAPKKAAATQKRKPAAKR